MNFEYPPESNPETPGTEKNLRKKRRLKDFLIVSGLVAASLGGISYSIISESRKEEISPDRYIELTEKKHALAKTEKKKLKESLEYIKNEFPPEVISRLNQANDEAVLWNSQDKNIPTTVSGFEEIGMKNENLQKIWNEKYYPKNWIAGNIQYILLEKGSVTPPKSFGIKDRKASGEVIDFTHAITLFSPETSGHNLNKTWVLLRDWVFSHELGHENDWINAPYLSPEERAEFLADVTHAFQRPNSFRDAWGYVNSIHNDDKHTEEYIKVREWWATLCEAYFTDSSGLEKKYPNDFAFIDERIKKRDPNFDPLDTSADRQIELMDMLK